MTRPNPPRLGRHRFRGLLILGLALSLGLPTASQAALMRYTITTTLRAGSNLNGVNVGGQVFTAYADINSSSATTVTKPSSTFATADSQAALISPVWFQVGSSPVGTITGLNTLSSHYERDYDPESGYQSATTLFDGPGGTLALDGNGTQYIDLRQTTVPLQVSGTFLVWGETTLATSMGALFFNAGGGNPGTITRAAVPEPSQVALAALAAGYALISAGRRCRARKPGAA